MRLVFVLYLGQTTFEFISTLLGIGVKSKPTCLKYSIRKENQIENISLRRKTSFIEIKQSTRQENCQRGFHIKWLKNRFTIILVQDQSVELHATEDCLITWPCISSVWPWNSYLAIHCSSYHLQLPNSFQVCTRNSEK